MILARVPAEILHDGYGPSAVDLGDVLYNT